ncbi:RimK family alpha-L-glutamate ligase [Streptomyces sp. NPDC049879]|uniref:RimK family alpha-L-glutamate ligase n=1 Tax=Streptomyces sp. NPDC049879 TaxID=3365598 RepID=UPI0037AEF239
MSAALLFNDKFATAEALADSPVPLIPSVRVTTGRDLARLDYQRLVPDAWFPVFVKPASWGRGLGCVRCPDRATLDAVLGLASGSGAAMVVQPSLGERLTDLRVVAVEGEIVAMYDRTGSGDSHVANVSRGGSVRERTDVAPEVRALLALVHRRFDLPYVCVDLLRTPDGRLWLSELELDGAVSALFGSPEAVRRVVGGRFLAYAARLAGHLGAPGGRATERLERAEHATEQRPSTSAGRHER